MKYGIGEMTVGDILDRGLKLLLTNLPAFYAINLIVLSPLIVFQLLTPSILLAAEPGNAMEAQLWSFVLGFLVVLLLTLILQPIGTAAILHIIAQEFVGQKVGIGPAFSFALRCFGALLGASILMGLAIAGGFLLFVIPGIIFWVWFVFTPQVVVVEKLAGSQALGRSKELTSGYRWRIFGLTLLIIVISAFIQAAAGMLQVVLPNVEHVPVQGPSGPMQREVIVYRNYAINAIVGQLVGILVGTYQSVCFTLMYFDLRIRKEGFDLELAARQQTPAVMPEREGSVELQ